MDTDECIRLSGAPHTRRLGTSGLSPATSFARRADTAKERTAVREQLAERTAVPNGRATAWRNAIVGGDMVVGAAMQLVGAIDGSGGLRCRRLVSSIDSFALPVAIDGRVHQS